MNNFAIKLENDRIFREGGFPEIHSAAAQLRRIILPRTGKDWVLLIGGYGNVLL